MLKAFEFRSLEKQEAQAGFPAASKWRLTISFALAAGLPGFAVFPSIPAECELTWVAKRHSFIAECASGIVWLAADAPQRETGKFWRDRKVIPS